jgi:hypothetical protein
MTTKQNEIWDFLVTNAVGLQNVVNIDDIATGIGEPPQGTNNDNVRNWIKQMVIKHNKPIGTCKDGVFLVTTDVEREIAAKFVERVNRANAVRSNGNYIP